MERRARSATVARPDDGAAEETSAMGTGFAFFRMAGDLLQRLAGLSELFNRFHPKETSRFLSHYALMLENGLPPIEILDSLRRQQSDPRFAKVIEDLIQKVFTGHSLAHAMKHHPRCFPSSVVLVVRAGEESGDIASRLRRASEMIDRAESTKALLKGALMGPAITVAASSVLLMGIVRFVLPQFVDLYAQMKLELPLISKLVFTVVTVLNHPFTIICALSAIAGLAAYRQVLKERLFELFLRVPWSRKVVGNILCASTCDTIAFLHKDGVPLHRALKLLVQSSPFDLHGRLLVRAEKTLTTSGSLSEAMQSLHYFPTIFHTMIVVGEESGDMAGLLEACRTYMDEEVNFVLEQVSAALEPLVICGLGICMAVLFVGMFLPIYGLLDHL